MEPALPVRRCGIRLFAHSLGLMLIGLLLLKGIPALGAEPPSLPIQVSESPLIQLQKLQAQHNLDSSDPTTLLQMSDLYFEIGEDIYQEEDQKRQAFENGSRLAKQVLDMEENNAEAHFLYAANLGGAAQISGVIASALTVNTLKTHAQRALELNPKHAPALHMMGMLLEELPWFLGGDPKMALTYLVRATKAKPDYTRARLDLAKAYIKRQNLPAAREELLLIVREPSGSPASLSRQRNLQEAQMLLDSLQAYP